MAMEFDLGSALVRVVMWHRREFVQYNLDPPEKALKIRLSREAYDAILASPEISRNVRLKEYIRTGQYFTTLAGIPVEISDDVRIMDIKDIRRPS